MVTPRVRRRDVLRGAGTIGGLAVAGRVAAGRPDRYNVGTASRAAERRTRREASSVHRVLDWRDGTKTISARLSDEAAANLRRRSDVRYVERDGTYQAIAETLPWGIDRVDADVAHDSGETGSGADVAIIDTGIDSDHPDLQANLGSGRAFVSCSEDCGGGGPPWARGGNDNSCHHDWDDDNDHGTHCAGTADAVDNSEGVVGVSTEATLHAVKVLDCTGSGSWSDVAAGIKHVADQGWDVGSMSLGGSSGSSAVEDACQYAVDNGVLLVAAAGNSGPCTDCVGYPAAYSTVVAVSATTETDQLADFSSTGPEVELAAPGEGVLSTVPGGYDTFSGTSMACPHVAGAGGQLMANGYTNTEARNQLNATAEDIGLSSNEQGSGLLNVDGALGLEDGSGTNSAPSCSIVDPTDGETVSGTVTVQVDAGDAEDDDTTLDVEVSVDDGAWQTAGYDSADGYYEYDWDSTGVGDGDHTLRARATDGDGATTESGQITVTVDNGSGGDTAPAIDQFSVSTRTTGPWFRAESDWAVSDPDGDLETVTTALLDSSGGVLDSASSSVDGGSASGTHEVRTRDTADSVRVTVRDAAGNSDSETNSV